MLTEQEMIDMARTIARSKSQPWHDVDDIEGFILLCMVKYKPKFKHHAARVAMNAKIDWIRKERGSKGQKVAIRNTYSLESNSHVPADEELGSVEEDLLSMLSSSQRRIAELLISGHHQKEIAQILDVSPSSVSTAVAEIKSITSQYLEREAQNA